MPRNPHPANDKFILSYYVIIKNVGKIHYCSLSHELMYLFLYVNKTVEMKATSWRYDNNNNNL